MALDSWVTPLLEGRLRVIGASLKKKKTLRCMAAVAFYGSLAGSLLSLAVYLFARYALPGARFLGILALGLLGLLVLFAYIGITFRVRPSLLGTAIFLDRELGLAERMATAVECLTDSKGEAGVTGIAGLLLEDAAERIRTLSPSDIPALRRRSFPERHWRLGVMLLLATAAALLVTPAVNTERGALADYGTRGAFLGEPAAKPPVGERIVSYLRDLLQPKSRPPGNMRSPSKKATDSSPGAGGEIPRAGGSPDDKEGQALLDQVRDMAPLLGEGNLSPGELNRLSETLKKLGAAGDPGNIYREALDALLQGDEERARRILDPLFNPDLTRPRSDGSPGEQRGEGEGGPGSSRSQGSTSDVGGSMGSPDSHGDESPGTGEGDRSQKRPGPGEGGPGEPGGDLRETSPTPGRTPGGNPLGEPAPRLGTPGPLVRLDGRMEEGQGESREITVFAPFSAKGSGGASPQDGARVPGGEVGEGPVSIERIPLEYREIVRNYFDLQD